MDKIVTASEVKSRFGEYLEQAIIEPIHISKTNRKVAVLISEREYERLKHLEDAYMAMQAQHAASEGYVSQQDIVLLLERLKNES